MISHLSSLKLTNRQMSLEMHYRTSRFHQRTLWKSHLLSDNFHEVALWNWAPAQMWPRNGESTDRIFRRRGMDCTRTKSLGTYDISVRLNCPSNLKWSRRHWSGRCKLRRWHIGTGRCYSRGDLGRGRQETILRSWAGRHRSYWCRHCSVIRLASQAPRVWKCIVFAHYILTGTLGISTAVHITSTDRRQ